MAITQAFTGSASISTTEYDLPNNSTTLSAQTADGVIQLFLDLHNMVAGDVYELKVYEKVESAGTQRVVTTWVFENALTDPHFVTPTLIFMHGWTFTMKRLAGTDRTIAWSIRSVA